MKGTVDPITAQYLNTKAERNYSYIPFIFDEQLQSNTFKNFF